MRFVIKLIIISLTLSFLYFVPVGIAADTQGIILVSLVGFLIIPVLLACHELNLLRIPALWRAKTERGGGTGSFRHVSYNGIDVHYTMKLNGGGLGLSHEFVHLVSKHIGKVGHIYEYCAGPGFIGFNLLANNLCDKLTLSDINPDAIKAINETIKNNALESRVTVYQSDGLASIPRNEKWDLIVSNPPWDIRSHNRKNLILCDPSGSVHKEIFEAAPGHLNADGTILFVESHEYTRKKDMAALIEGTDLTLSRYFPPTPFSAILKSFSEYKNISRSMAATLRFALCVLEIYFIHLKPAPAPRVAR